MTAYRNLRYMRKMQTLLIATPTNTTANELPMNLRFSISVSSESIGLSMWNTATNFVVGFPSKQLYQLNPQDHTWQLVSFGAKSPMQGLGTAVAVDSTGIATYSSPTHQGACILGYQYIERSLLLAWCVP